LAVTWTGLPTGPVGGLVITAVGFWFGVSHGIVVVVVVVVVLVVDVVLVVVVDVVVVLVVVVLVVVVVVVVGGASSPPPVRTAAAPPPTTSAPPAIRIGDTPPVTNPTGRAPLAEPITTLEASAIGASGPAEHEPSCVTSSECSPVRLSDERLSVAAT